MRADIIEHFPAPYPLDAALAEAALRCLRSTLAVAGIRMDGRSPLSIDDDGLMRMTHPRLTLWGLPWGVLHVAALPWSDPRQWGMREGARARAAAERLAALPATRLPTAALAGALGRTLAEIEALERARFIGYLGFHVLRGARIDMLLRLARTRCTQYDLLGDLDYATVVVDRDLAALAAAAPEPSARPAGAWGAADRGTGRGAGRRGEQGAGRGRRRCRNRAGTGPVTVEAVRAADPQWWQQAEAFLARHGSRGTTMYQAFSSSSWSEDLPAFLTAVALTMRDGQAAEGPGPVRHAQVMAEALGRLPRALRPGFRRLVADYRAGHLMREDSVVEFERLSAVARGLALESGSRMCEAGLIDQPGQVVYLRLEELRSWLGGEEVDVAAIVRRRVRARPRAEAAWWEGLEDLPVAAGAELAGVGASPGTVTAAARVINGPADFALLQPGEVLVCRSTEPAWTPLFARAVAVIAETGGRLSHAAIVAREYSIPAVLGVAGATTLIADGERLTVDGARGRVLRGR